jgi:hypothetical protein
VVERDLRRLGREQPQRSRERPRLLRRDPRLGLRRERRGPEPEVAVLLGGEPVHQPAGRLLHPPVVLEPAGQLLRGLLRVEVGELDALLGEELPCLQLEQRADEEQELAARVEVEPLTLCHALDERDDDLGDVDVARLQLLAQDERQQQVEGSFERVEVELELADVRHRAEASGVGGRGPSGPPSWGPSGSAAACAARSGDLPPCG